VVARDDLRRYIAEEHRDSALIGAGQHGDRPLPLPDRWSPLCLDAGWHGDRPLPPLLWFGDV